MKTRHSAIMALAAAAAATIVAGCTHTPEDVKQTVEAFGMTDIEVGGYAWWGCPRHSGDFRTAFTATTATGQRVKGVVCGDLIDGNSVHILGPAR